MIRIIHSSAHLSRKYVLLLAGNYNRHHLRVASSTSLASFLSRIEDSLLLTRKFPVRPRNNKENSSKPRDHPVYDSKGHPSAGSGEEEDGKGNKNEEEDMRKKLIALMKRALAISLFTYGVLIILGPAAPEEAQESLSWSDFVAELLPSGQVYRIIVYPESDVADVFLVSRFEMEVRAAEQALGLPPDQWTQIQYRRVGNTSQWIFILALLGIVAGLAFAFKKMKGFNMTDIMSNMTKGKYTVIDPHSPEGKKLLKVKFKDVAGLNEAKVEIREFVDYLKNPTRFTKLGAKLPKGALLTGPPGCGKTLLAKALAAESIVPFISMNGSEFVEVIGGLGASRIRGLFKEARQKAPCIIYIDEIDAIGRKRSEGNKSGVSGSGEEEQTLNQLLVEMDGMGSDNGVIVLASTNRGDILDKALLRPGRFDRHITIDLPTLSERKDMFELYLKRVKLDHPATRHAYRLAQMTPGFSGADISNVVNEAAIHAASHSQKLVSLKDLEFALDRVIAGAEKRSRSLVEEEREIVAYHEAGHALVGWMLEHTDALLKVTIIPRTSAALGFAQYNPRDKKLYSREELFDRMCMMLGGRAAESLKFGRITTGAHDDLQKVTKSASAQVKIYGMNERIGPLSFPNTDGFDIKPYSKHFGAMFDQEANLIVRQAYEATTQVLKDNVDKLETIAQALLKREVLNYEDVKQLIGPPKFGDKHVVDFVESVLPKEDKL
ncbi:unnamed protein product [Caenorhabditis auriculariae]|uniref:AAA+ ATPase domain-containing protein n=1 Tax=Caenorhabditis auriculariae TaxID=2777116 RepID=A0A8S1H8D2_9PELO|nr:unnamed protein product [Caenorhabditis auriculariae]